VKITFLLSYKTLGPIHSFANARWASPAVPSRLWSTLEPWWTIISTNRDSCSPAEFETIQCCHTYIFLHDFTDDKWWGSFNVPDDERKSYFVHCCLFFSFWSASSNSHRKLHTFLYKWLRIRNKFLSGHSFIYSSFIHSFIHSFALLGGMCIGRAAEALQILTAQLKLRYSTMDHQSLVPVWVAFRRG
jgi:hypothetical protein